MSQLVTLVNSFNERPDVSLVGAELTKCTIEKTKADICLAFYIAPHPAIHDVAGLNTFLHALVPEMDGRNWGEFAANAKRMVMGYFGGEETVPLAENDFDLSFIDDRLKAINAVMPIRMRLPNDYRMRIGAGFYLFPCKSMAEDVYTRTLVLSERSADVETLAKYGITL